MSMPTAVVPSVGVVGALALAGSIMAIRWGGWAGWTIGIIAAIAALGGLGFLGFAVWGRYAGMPWGFS